MNFQDIEHRGKGSSDGYFQGYQYFDCEQNCGMFVSLETIRHGVPQSQTQHIPVNKASDTHSKGASSHQSSGTSKSISYNASDVDPPRTSTTKAKPRFRLNDRVVVFNKDDIALFGTVKWTGKKSRLEGLEGGRIIHVGIEMVCVHRCVYN